ncbi:MAG: DUF6288 domain-containing protein [Akkermansiaceae bacterium]|nr:DUF6288 domain-containing protein [Akkermansiaceae bacterium]
MNRFIQSARLAGWMLAAGILPLQAAAPNGGLKNPDFTKGETIPEGAKHDWTLGATGARGWIYSDKLVTTDARQIAVTQVDPGSPSDRMLVVGDVILGVGGRMFSHDPRTEMGKALTLAESEKGGGKLPLTRWRDGKTEEIVIQLPVLGTYSATAPYDCAKSKRILEQGCEAIAKRIADPSHNRQDPITRSLNALALLASGNSDYLPQIQKEAQWAAAYSEDSMQTWYYGYVMLFLSEYVMATADSSVMPGLKRLALEAARGQSAVGSWGHKFALPDGRLGGYGMMNSPGLPLTISMVMARAAGVKDPDLDRAIELSARLMRFYIGKGAIPYGDHDPWIENHDDNGKCGMAAVLFNLLGEKDGAEFFARMSLACHGPERDTGHTGNFFNMLWAMPGVAQSGPQATGAWMNEFGAWYFDLARRWDGSFTHQGPPDKDHDSYRGWDATGAYLLAYAMPLKKLYLTGKRPPVIPQLDHSSAESLIRDGRGWSNNDRHSAYDKLGGDSLLECLESWSPVVRERAAMALARRKVVAIPPLIQLLESPGLTSRLGACQALAALRGRAAPAVEPLRKALQADDLWLRVKAAEALASIGAPANAAVPDLLRLLAQGASKTDPRGMQQRYLTYALFQRRDGMLGRSLEGIDREALYLAVREGLKNQDGRARGCISSIYQNLSLEEIKPLLPAILKAIEEPAPSGEMFADEVRVEGLRVLAKHRIKEGLAACVKYTRNQNPWNSQERTPELMKIVLGYGTHAKAFVPELTQIGIYFDKDEKDFPRKLMTMKANCIRETIRTIEASTDTPPLIQIATR